MQVKLDENLGQRGIVLFRQAGHDVATVTEESLTSATDHQLIEVCQQEQRGLVTLDMDFSNPLIFKPSNYSGIAVLRLPNPPQPEDLYEAIRTLLAGLTRESMTGKLWIVQRNRIRVYQEDLQEDEP